PHLALAVAVGKKRAVPFDVVARIRAPLSAVRIEDIEDAVGSAPATLLAAAGALRSERACIAAAVELARAEAIGAVGPQLDVRVARHREVAAGVGLRLAPVAHQRRIDLAPGIVLRPGGSRRA